MEERPAPQPSKPQLSNDDYHVGWICALQEELTAGSTMLDEKHEGPAEQDPNDHNTYFLGRIHKKHNVVMAALPAGRYGKAATATVASDMVRTFKNLRIGMLVGIGGGLPDLEDPDTLRLGDVDVSQPDGNYGGVIQYDIGKKEQGGYFRRQNGMLNSPPSSLLTALTALQATHDMEDSRMTSFISEAQRRYPKITRTGYTFPGAEKDHLFRSSALHIPDTRDCSGCDQNARIPRVRVADDDTPDNSPRIYYGTILSADIVLKDSVERDRLIQVFQQEKVKALCVEMEAAGLMNKFPCLVIRGICDYADSHKNDGWHKYAALTAAAYAKELLWFVSPGQMPHQPIQNIIG